MGTIGRIFFIGWASLWCAGQGLADTAFLALRNAGAVVALDIDTGAIIERIPVGTLPRSTTASADGKRVFVINEGDISVSIIDTTTLSLERTIDMRAVVRGGSSSSPIDVMGNIGAAPDGSAFYVAGQFMGALRFDLRTDEIIGFGLGGSGEMYVMPGSMPEISTDGRRLYLMSHPNLLILDAQTMKPAGRLPSTNGFSGTGSVFRVSPDGEIVISDDDFGRFTFGNLATFTSEQILIPMTGSGTDSRGMAFAPDGSRVYRSRGDGTIHIIDIASRSVVMRSKEGISRAGIAVSPDGRLLVAMDPASNRVTILDAASLEVLRVVEIAGNPTAYGQFIVTSPATALDATVRPQRDERAPEIRF